MVAVDEATATVAVEAATGVRTRIETRVGLRRLSLFSCDVFGGAVVQLHHVRRPGWHLSLPIPHPSFKLRVQAAVRVRSETCLHCVSPSRRKRFFWGLYCFVEAVPGTTPPPSFSFLVIRAARHLCSRLSRPVSRARPQLQAAVKVVSGRLSMTPTLLPPSEVFPFPVRRTPVRNRSGPRDASRLPPASRALAVAANPFPRPTY